jgi:hypothetical protein
MSRININVRDIGLNYSNIYADQIIVTAICKQNLYAYDLCMEVLQINW